MLTYNKIIDFLFYFADNHGQIKSKGYGEIKSVNQFENIQYPLFWVVPTSTNLDSTSIDLEYNILLMDKLQESKSNEIDVHSDMLSIASDLRAWLSENASEYFTIIESSNVQFFSERFHDYLAGVNIKLKINAEWDWNRCLIPGIGSTLDYESNIIIPNSYSQYMPLSGGTFTGCVYGPCADFENIYSGGTPLLTIINNLISGQTPSVQNLIFSAGTGLILITGSTPNVTYQVNPNLSVTNFSANTVLLQAGTVVGQWNTGGLYNSGNIFNDGNIDSLSIEADYYTSGGTEIGTLFGNKVISVNTGGKTLIEGQTGNTVGLYGLNQHEDNNIILKYESDNTIEFNLNPNVNISSISASTIYSGSTDLNTYFNNLSQSANTNAGNISVINAQLNTKANISGQTFTGNVSVPVLSANTFFSGSTDLNTYFNNLTQSAITNASNISSQNARINTKANISGQTFTGNVSIPVLSADTLFSGSTLFENLVPHDFSSFRIKGSTANRYHTSANFGFAFSNQSITSGRLYFCPFVVGHHSLVIDRLGISLPVSGSSVNDVIRLGIYSADTNNIPSTLIVDAGTVTASASTNLTTIALSQNLNPGLYYLAALSNYTLASAIRCIPSTAYNNPLGWNTNPTLGVSSYYYNDVGYGALPTSAGTLTTTTTAMPAIFVRIT